MGQDKPHEKLSTEFLPSAGQTLRQTLLVPTINNTVFSGSTKWAVGMPNWEQNRRQTAPFRPNTTNTEFADSGPLGTMLGEYLPHWMVFLQGR